MIDLLWVGPNQMITVGPIQVITLTVAVAAMVDRLVHHAEVIPLQGDSYRLKDRTKEVEAGSKSP